MPLVVQDGFHADRFIPMARMRNPQNVADVAQLYTGPQSVPWDGDKFVFFAHLAGFGERRLRHIVDVGANIGHTMIRHCEFADRVTGFEPTPLAVDIARRNIAFNLVTNGSRLGYDSFVRLYQAAVTHRDGVFQLNNNFGNAAINRVRNPYRATATRPRTRSELIAVQGVALDSMGLEDVDAIKIDVEGGELMVLQGAQQLIERDRPVVQVELLEVALGKFDHTPQMVFDWFAERGYHAVDRNGAHCGNRWQYMRGRVDTFFVPGDRL